MIILYVVDVIRDAPPHGQTGYQFTRAKDQNRTPVKTTWKQPVLNTNTKRFFEEEVIWCLGQHRLEKRKKKKKRKESDEQQTLHADHNFHGQPFNHD